MEQHPAARCAYEWRNTLWGTLCFEVDVHLDEIDPPTSLITSSRAVVLRGREVLVVESPDHHHIWPGGRRESGEDLKQTAAREVLEETGCHVQVGRRLGRVRFVHQQPRPDDYPFPHPVFWQVVYLAHAQEAVARDWTDSDGWELGAEFVDIDDVPDLDAVQQALLQASRQSR